MQCKYCSAQTYVSHLCPCCKGHYCNDHKERNTHNCPSNELLNNPTSTYLESKQLAPLRGTRLRIRSINVGIVQKELFFTAFALLLAEEALRLTSYVRNSPSMELNIYVAIASTWLTPYVASSVIFLSACLLLLVTKKKLQTKKSDSAQKDLLKRATSIGIYGTVAIMSISSLAGWVFVLLT